MQQPALIWTAHAGACPFEDPSSWQYLQGLATRENMKPGEQGDPSDRNLFQATTTFE
jgi:hypothetical protein